VYVFDPYSIALSKVARGFESDLKDVLFLLREGYIQLDELEKHVRAALPQAWDFDIDPTELLQHLETIRQLYRA
jgi:DNA repair ATPase RecN